MSLLLDHLWQSSAVLAVIGLWTIAFRRNGAQVRHALWTAASLKFLLPFALLNWLGIWLAPFLSLRVRPVAAIETIFAASQPFSDGPLLRAIPVPAPMAWHMILGAWLVGIVALLLLQLSRWWRLRAVMGQARAADIAAPMRVKLSPARLEPGLVGIFRPVLLLPNGITERLSADELRCVIAHEACHMRRRDNLWAALHMLVEALFWFWPPVWWLGARLIAEREQACDETVLAAGNQPRTYAEAILKVCKFYASSPLACAAGIAGANLNQRMMIIMDNKNLADLKSSKKILLKASAVGLVLTPIAAGLLFSPAAVAQGAACTPVAVMRTHTVPPYPTLSRKARETGVVDLTVTVAKDGHASAASVAHSSGAARLDEAAASYVRLYYSWEPLACRSAKTDVRVVYKLAPAAAPSAKP